MALRFVFLLFLSLGLTGTLIAQTIPTPTQTGTIIIDNGAAGKADPNDRIQYKVIIQNTGGANGTGVQLNVVPDPRTTLVPGSFRSSPLALPDAYACTGNVGLNVPAASGLKANDFDDNIAGLTCTAGTFATTQNGSITIAADGSFTYTPPAGFTGTDTYTYTVNDGNGIGGGVPATDNALITFTISNLIYFIDNSSMAATSDGRLTSPFKSLADFNANSTATSDVIYIEQTGTNYTGGIVLANNERLFGEGHTGGANLASVLPFSLAPNSPPLPNINGTRPIITNTSGDGVGLASDNSLRGFNVGDCFDFGMENLAAASVGSLTISEVAITNTSGGGFKAGNGGTLAVTFSSLSSSGGTGGINLSGGCTGTFVGGSGAISGSSGAAFLVSGGTVAVDYDGTLTKTSTGNLVDIQTHATGAISLDGNLSSTGASSGILANGNTSGIISFNGGTKTLNTGANTAVTLSSNTGATINFTGGGLAITATSGSGFSATGGGTVTVQGTNNTITSTTGTALNVANTTIGASNLNFQSISANGATNGIVLNTTGSSGGLIITGTGTTDGSGGTIQNIANRGVSAISTINLSLKNMTFTDANTTNGSPCSATNNSGCNAAIHLNTVTNATLDNIDIDDTAQQGINLLEVNGFQLLNSTIINGGDEVEEADLYAINLFGTCAITSSSLTVPAERAAVIYNTSKTMTLTVTGSTFGMNQTQPLGADGLEVNSYGASNTTLDIVNCTFVQPKTNGLQVITEGTSFCSVDVTGSTFDPGAGLAAAIDLVTNNSGDMDFNIVNNPLIKSRAINAVNIFGFAGSKFEGRVNNNTINVGGGSGSGAGVRVNAQGNLNSLIEIKNNNITGADDYGITNVASLGSGRLDVTVTGNTISLSNLGFYGIHTAAGVSGSTFTNKVCANVANNITTAVPIPNAIGNWQARAATATHEILLQGTGANVATIWNNNSNTPINPPATISQSGVGVFTFGATCSLPLNPNP